MLEKDYGRLDFSLIVNLLILVLDANLRESLFLLSSLFRSLYTSSFFADSVLQESFSLQLSFI